MAALRFACSVLRRTSRANGVKQASSFHLFGALRMKAKSAAEFVPDGDLVGDMLDVQCSNYPKKNALHSLHEENLFNFEELKEEANAIGRGFLEYGFKAGDTIATWLGDTSFKIHILLGAAKAGLHVVSIHPDIHHRKLIQYTLNEFKCKGLIFDSDYRSDVEIIHNIPVTRLRTVKKAIPDLEKGDMGALLKLKSFPHLRIVAALDEEMEEIGIWRYEELQSFDSSMDFLLRDRPNLSMNRPICTDVAEDDTGYCARGTVNHSQVFAAVDEIDKVLDLNADDRVSLLGGCFSIEILITAALTINSFSQLSLAGQTNFIPYTLECILNERPSVLVGNAIALKQFTSIDSLSNADISFIKKVVVFDSLDIDEETRQAFPSAQIYQFDLEKMFGFE